MFFDPWQWCVLHVAAALMGVSKTGIPGVAILGVALFASVFDDARQATGLVLLTNYGDYEGGGIECWACNVT